MPDWVTPFEFHTLLGGGGDLSSISIIGSVNFGWPFAQLGKMTLNIY